MPCELLNIPEGPASFGDLLGGSGDEGPAAAVTTGALQSQLLVNPMEPDSDRGRSIAASALRMNNPIGRSAHPGRLQDRERGAQVGMKRHRSTTLAVLAALLMRCSGDE